MTYEIINLEPPLTDEERDQLTKLEGIISKNLKAFIATGIALSIIKERNLYRENHKNWDLYCQDKWDLKRRHTYHLIDSVRVIENLSTMTDRQGNVHSRAQNPEVLNTSSWVQNDDSIDKIYEIVCTNDANLPLPLNEYQCRLLVPLKPAQQRVAWKTALETLPEGKKMTASHIKKTINDLFNEDDGVSAPRQGHYEVSDKWHGAIQTLIDAFAKAREEGFKDMTKNAALRQLRDLIATIEADDI